MFWEIFFSMLFAVAIGLFGAYVMVKKTLKVEKFAEIAEILISDSLSDAEFQKVVKEIGVMFGQGLAQSVGVGGKGGKFKLEDIIGLVVMRYLGGGMPQILGNVEAPPSSPPQNTSGNIP